MKALFHKLFSQSDSMPFRLTYPDGTTENGYYTLTTTGGATFTITATANNGDIDCTSMTLTSAGIKGGAGADSSKCW